MEDAQLCGAKFAHFCLSPNELYNILCWKWKLAGCPRPFTFTMDTYTLEISVGVILLSCDAEASQDGRWTFEDLEHVLHGFDPCYQPSIKCGPLLLGKNLAAARALAAQGSFQGWKIGNGALAEVMLVDPHKKIVQTASAAMSFDEYLKQWP